MAKRVFRVRQSHPYPRPVRVAVPSDMVRMLAFSMIFLGLFLIGWISLTHAQTPSAVANASVESVGEAAETHPSSSIDLAAAGASNHLDRTTTLSEANATETIASAKNESHETIDGASNVTSPPHADPKEYRAQAAGGAFSRAIWFIVIVTVLPLICCCCLLYATYSICCSEMGGYDSGMGMGGGFMPDMGFGGGRGCIIA